MHALTLALLTTTARAGDLAWDWTAETVGKNNAPRRYHAEAMLVTHHGVVWQAKNNLDARAFQTELAMDTTCTGTEENKRLVKVTCTIDSLAMSGIAMQVSNDALRRKEQKDLDAIFEEYGQTLEGTSIVMMLRKDDGRITNLDLEGVDIDMARYADVAEGQRQLMRRVFATLDLATPKGGEAKGSWRHKGSPLAIGLMTAYGAAGGARLVNEVVKEQGDDVWIDTSGEAVVDTPELQASLKKVSLMIAGKARFDTERGTLAYRQLTINGQLTASSMGSVTEPQYFDQASWIGLIQEDGSYATLDPSKSKPSKPEATVDTEQPEHTEKAETGGPKATVDTEAPTHSAGGSTEEEPTHSAGGETDE